MTESDFNKCQRLANKALRFAELSGYAKGDYAAMERRICDYAREQGVELAAKGLASTKEAFGAEVQLDVTPESVLARLREHARRAARCSRAYRAQRFPESGCYAYDAARDAARVMGYVGALQVA